MTRIRSRINFWKLEKNTVYFWLSKSSPRSKLFTGSVKSLDRGEDLDIKGSKKRLQLASVFALLERIKKLGFF